MAFGVAKTRAVTGQVVVVGEVANVTASGVSAIRREERLDGDGNPVWVDAGDVTIGTDVWPANTPPPQTGQMLTLADGKRYRVGYVTATPALIAFNFTSLY